MNATILHTTALYEIWQRRHEPESNDLIQVLRLAGILESDTKAPQALLGLAFRLAHDVHEAAGWAIPAGVHLARCFSAATSVRQTALMLLEEVRPHLRRVEGPVALLGALGASQALFGCWDMLPAQGEILVRLGDGQADPVPNAPLSQHGVRWTGAGHLGEDLQEWTTPATLVDRQVLVPKPELLVARANGLDEESPDLAAVVFCAAAYLTAGAGTWAQALELSRDLGRARAPVETAMRLGITDWLGLSVGPITRLSVNVRGLLGGHRQPAHT